MIITSSQNPVYKKIMSLTKSKGLQEYGMALLAGEKITEEYAKNFPERGMFWISCEELPSPSRKFSKDVLLDKQLFEDIDVCGSHRPVLCVTTPEVQDFSKIDPEKPALYCALGDPSNLGALLRSARAFGVSQIVLLKESAHPFLPKSLRASSGYGLDFQYFSGPAIANLEVENLCALDMSGSPLRDAKLHSNLHLLIGEEGQGVPESFTGEKLAIPMAPGVESLNASVSVGIFLYEWQKQRDRAN